MGLEQRGDREYYYRKRRVGGQVVSEYVAAGEQAGRCAAMDALQREEERLARSRERQALAAEAALDAAIDQAGEFATAMAEGCLLVNGYHVHNGEWRMSRNARIC